MQHFETKAQAIDWITAQNRRVLVVKCNTCQECLDFFNNELVDWADNIRVDVEWASVDLEEFVNDNIHQYQWIDRLLYPLGAVSTDELQKLSDKIQSLSFT
jgi:hypothetical protein